MQGVTIKAGVCLGPYEILSPIGAGGMGEVYKARDTRLDRTVAVKVLPSHLSDNPERKERFEREARAVSSLNHPHICTLHDIGSENGVDYMVMEYVEGETLADRLKKGALPLDKALEYGIQIADALDKAHRQGVVHRDLKPGNVMLTKPGAKLLDFGLAKLQPAGIEVGHDSALPTQQKDLTKDGAILGTIQYMAPEQLEGKEADARADIFAFGALLYEMVTGKKAFHGESQASLITAIMSSEPRPLSEIQPLSPPLLERVLAKCLTKEPDDRWESARDLMLTLKWVGEPRGEQEVSVGMRPSRRKRLLWAGVTLLAMAFSGLVVWKALQPAPPGVIRMTVNLPDGQELFDGPIPPFAISPDGKRLVFASRSPTLTVTQLYSREIGEFEARPIPGTDRAEQPFFSPDGRFVGFVETGRQIIKKVTLAGGSPSTICQTALDPHGFTWTKDDMILFGTNGSGLWRVSVEGGTPEPVTRLATGETSHRLPRPLPDGKGVLFTITKSASRFIGILAPGENEHHVLFEGHGAHYLPSGHLINALGEELIALPYDLDSLEATGAPLSIADDLNLQAALNSLFKVGDDGTIVFASSKQSPVSIVWVDRQGRESSIQEVDGRYHMLRLSPEGRRFAADETARSAIWVHDIERGTRVLVASGQGALIPLWSPDGSQIAYASSGGDLYSRAADGTGEPRRLLTRENTQWPLSWSPDGQFLALTDFGSTTGRDIWTLPRDGRPEPFVSTSANENAAAFSPDGHWIVYQSDESGQSEIYV